MISYQQIYLYTRQNVNYTSSIRRVIIIMNSGFRIFCCHRITAQGGSLPSAPLNMNWTPRIDAILQVYAQNSHEIRGSQDIELPCNAMFFFLRERNNFMDIELLLYSFFICNARWKSFIFSEWSFCGIIILNQVRVFFWVSVARPGGSLPSGPYDFQECWITYNLVYIERRT